MARHFGPIVPPNDPRKCQPWLNKELRRISTHLQQSASGFAAIVRGEAPDGSGDPLVPPIDLSQFFYLPGRDGGQEGHGDTAAGGSLTLSSTFSSTKGKIYLGDSLTQFIFDELQSLLGLNIIPEATFHVKGSLDGGSSSSVILTNSDTNSNWGTSRSGFGGGAIGDPAWQSFSSDDDETTYVAMNIGGPSGGAVGTNPQICGLNGTIQPGVTYSVLATVSALFTIPTSLTYLGIELVDSNGDVWRDDNFTSNTGLQIPEVIDHSNFHRVTRSVTCGSLTGGTGTPNTVRIYLAGQTNSGLTGVYMALSYLAISQAGADLIRWDLADGSESGRIDLFGHLGVGTATANLVEMFSVIGDSVSTVTAKIKAIAAQTSDLLRFTDSSDVALSGYTAAGKPYLVAGAATDATLVSDASGVGSWATLVSYEDEAIFYEDSPVYY